MAEGAGLVEIHPLVITSVCDHYTRVTVSGSLLPSHAPTIGLLFGTKDGKNISICDATEAVYKYANGNVNLMSQFIQKKKQLWTAVYTTQELIGWYYVGTSIESLHVQLHREILAHANADTLLFLLMSPDVENSATNLPLSVYDFDSQKQIFLYRPFQLQSSLVEKVAIDEVLKSSPTNGKSSLEIQNESLLSSINALISRIDILVNALEKMKSGTLPRDEELLRQISQITLQIPPNVYLSDSLQQNMKKEIEETLALSLINLINTDMMALNELSATYHTIYNKDRFR